MNLCCLVDLNSEDRVIGLLILLGTCIKFINPNLSYLSNGWWAHFVGRDGFFFAKAGYVTPDE